jgi:phenylacetate-CoA ligase
MKKREVEIMYSTGYRAMRLAWPGGLETRRHLRELNSMQWLTRQELEAWQFEKLQELVRYAYEHVPYYRERYRREDIHPQDIRSLEDFQALPFLTREDVNENLDALVSSEFQGKLYSNFTGGSTGQPMRFFVDDSYWWWNAALVFRARGWHGVQEGDKVAWVWGARQDMPSGSRKERLRARIMRQRYLNAFDLTEQEMRTFAEMLIRWQPAMFRAYASALSLFAEFIQEQGLTGIRPTLIETTAEKVTDPQRDLLSSVFHCPVADCYSSREMGTMTYECEAGGMHVCETRYLEIVDNDQVVAPGELGEVAVTSLHQFGMPLIRYKNGDLAIGEAGTCICGRGMPLLREIVGRTVDYLVTTDGQLVHGCFFVVILGIKPEVRRYQVYQPDREHLEVRLVCNQQVDATWLENLSNEIRAHFGAPMQVSLLQVDDIALTPAGKHRLVISDVKPDLAS